MVKDKTGSRILCFKDNFLEFFYTFLEKSCNLGTNERKQNRRADAIWYQLYGK